MSQLLDKQHKCLDKLRWLHLRPESWQMSMALSSTFFMTNGFEKHMAISNCLLWRCGTCHWQERPRVTRYMEQSRYFIFGTTQIRQEIHFLLSFRHSEDEARGVIEAEKIGARLRWEIIIFSMLLALDSSPLQSSCLYHRTRSTRNLFNKLNAAMWT